MTSLVNIVLFAWFPVVLMLFAILRPRHAVITAYIAGWLFLPFAGFDLPGLPAFTKITATSYAVLVGALLFDSDRVLRFRPRWIDLPMILWCLVPLATSVTNDLGVYDGLAGVAGKTITWGLPFFIGRLYFGDLIGLRELAIGIVIGGLVYVPLCLYEIRMSPQLHRMFYGYHVRGWSGMRFGGYRPSVFLDTGLALGIWMTVASLMGVWLWRTKSLLSIRGVPMSLLVSVLLMTTILCKSTGALILLFVGIAVLMMTKWTRSPILLACLVAAPILFIGLRSTGRWSGDVLVELSGYISEERARSLQSRLENDDILAEKAWRRPIFGWGTWGRNRVYDDQGRDMSTTDGLWIIAFGHNGIVGLAALYTTLLLPAVLLLRRVPARQWATPAIAPAAALAVIVVLFAIDCLFNAMFNPIFLAAAGGLAGLVHMRPYTRRISPSSPSPWVTSLGRIPPHRVPFNDA